MPINRLLNDKYRLQAVSKRITRRSNKTQRRQLRRAGDERLGGAKRGVKNLLARGVIYFLAGRESAKPPSRSAPRIVISLRRRFNGAALARGNAFVCLAQR